ncbi:hypothetical protein [Streptomyces syringium]|uniref:hypothetical protein n=1 Tax=Streptomyces syringium TaxID=76729 RepID=UPI0033DD65C3
MRIPFVSDTLYRRKLRRELINAAHHDYYRALNENEALHAELRALREQSTQVLKAGADMMAENTAITQAALDLANAFAKSGSAFDIAPSLTCFEVDALARLFAAVGRTDLARKWLEDHATEDTEAAYLHGIDDDGKPIDLDDYLVTLAA